MAKDMIKIHGVLGFDGEYVFDWGALTGDEAHLMKQLSGVRLNEIDDAIRYKDWAFHISTAVIALRRAGHRHANDAFEALMQQPIHGIISIEPIDDDDDDAGESVRDLDGPPGNSGTSGGDG